MSAHLNQDCLENLFSRVRAVGGSNSHPTSVDFIHCLKKLIVGCATGLVVETASVKMEDKNCQEDSSGILSQLLTKAVDCEQIQT